MSRTHYTPPPSLGDIPAFLKKAFLAKHVRDLIKWATTEYDTGLTHLMRHASPRTLQFFYNEYSPMRVLAESAGFREALEYLNEQNYNQLSARERKFIRHTYELFKALS